MDVLITHESALEYWRVHGNTKIENEARKRRKSVPVGLPEPAETLRRIPPGLSQPVSLMTSKQNFKRRFENTRPRMYTGENPEWGFVKIEEAVFVSSPQLCFFQMATELPLVRLIQLGIEFCGTYSLPANNEHEKALHDAQAEDLRNEHLRELNRFFDQETIRERKQELLSGYDKEAETTPQGFYDRSALTSVKELKNFAERMEGVKGRKKAFRALRYIAGGSASPRETILFMLLTLPYKLGGYGLPAPEFNKQIKLGKAAKQRAGKAFFKCDLFWPKEGIAVEYDSNKHHTGAERIADDAKKRQELDELGVYTIPVTNDQMKSEFEFEIVARHIAGKIGRRLRPKNPEFQKARSELRGLLL